MKNKDKKNDDDDGRTISNMNVDGFSWYKSKKQQEKHEEIKKQKLSKKEIFSIIWAGIKTYLPMIMCIIAGFTLVFLLLYIWLL